MKVRLSLPSFLSIVPLAGFLWLLFYAAVARLQVGHWPMYARPDPTDIRPWLTGYALMGVLMVFMFASPVAFAAMFWTSSRGAIRAETSREKVRQWAVFAGQVAVFVFGATLFAGALLHLRDWLLD